MRASCGSNASIPARVDGNLYPGVSEVCMQLLKKVQVTSSDFRASDCCQLE